MEKEDKKRFFYNSLGTINIERTSSFNPPLFGSFRTALALRIAHGLPRAINHLAQRAFEEAARANTRLIRREQVQQALDLLPWLGRLREEET